MKLINPAQVERFRFCKEEKVYDKEILFTVNHIKNKRSEIPFSDKEIYSVLSEKGSLGYVKILNNEVLYKSYVEMKVASGEIYKKYFTSNEEMFEFKDGLMSGEIKWIEL